jgi:hypothetical protein
MQDKFLTGTETVIMVSVSEANPACFPVGTAGTPDFRVPGAEGNARGSSYRLEPAQGEIVD